MAFSGYLAITIFLAQLLVSVKAIHDEDIRYNKQEQQNQGYFSFDPRKYIHEDIEFLPPSPSTSNRHDCAGKDISLVLSKITENMGPHFITQNGKAIYSNSRNNETPPRQWHAIFRHPIDDDHGDKGDHLHRLYNRIHSSKLIAQDNEEETLLNATAATTTTATTTIAPPTITTTPNSLPLDGPLANANFINLSAWDSHHQQNFNNEKGEVLIHRPAPIIVNRPPTKVVVNHPPLIVKPAPVIFHRPPSVIVRPIILKPKPESVTVQPLYIKVIKPPTPEKIYIKEQVPCNEAQYRTNYAPKHRYYGSQFDY